MDDLRAVTQDLHLDMSSGFDQPFQIDPRIAKRRMRLRHRQVERRFQLQSAVVPVSGHGHRLRLLT